MIHPRKAHEEHPLFRAMVLMGSSVALGCGGATRDGAPSSGNGSSPGMGGGGDGEDQAGRGSAGGSHPVVITTTGGTTPVSGGGSSGMTRGGAGGAAGSISGVGGGIEMGLPASGGVASASFRDADGGPGLPCPPAQWACSTAEVACSDVGYALGSASLCRCDPTQPTSPGDCEAGQVLACRAFERSADYSMILDPPIAFDCHCVTPGAACYDTCNATFHSNWPTHCLGTDGGATLCGCANITLR